LAEELGIPFIECSAKTGENIGEAFSLLLSEIEKENPAESALQVEQWVNKSCVLS
jgi:Fe2+ transport system protein B